MPPTVTIRPLTSTDATTFRDLRLRALAEAPEAFGASLEEEGDQPLDAFARRLAPPEPSQVFGALRDDHGLTGIAGFLAYTGLKTRHIGLLWGVYVAPQWRSSGIGAALLDAVIDHARQHVLVLHADVGVDNHAARRLYESRGFRCYGVLPRALRVEGRFIDEALLALDLANDV